MTLSLILPCYNPPQGWERNIVSVYRVFSKRIGLEPEVIIVFDGAFKSINPAEIKYLEDNLPKLRLISYEQNRGKGYAIRQGVAVADSDIIIYTDIDLPYTVESMIAIFEGLSSNAFDAGIGVKDEAYYAHLPPARRYISKCLRLLIRLFLSIPITDTQCGLKGFRSNVKPLFLKTTIDRYLFDLEFIRNSFLSGKFRIQPVPVTLNEAVQFRKMNYSILIPEMLNFARLLFKKTHE